MIGGLLQADHIITSDQGRSEQSLCTFSGLLDMVMMMMRGGVYDDCNIVSNDHPNLHLTIDDALT